MKILHICREKNESNIGGVENHIKYMTEAQLKLNLEPVVLTFAWSDSNHVLTRKRNGVVWYFIQIKDPVYELSKWFHQFEGGKLGVLITAVGRLRQNYCLSEKIRLISEINPNIIHQHDYLSCLRLNQNLTKRYAIVFTNHYGEYLILKKTAVTRYFQNRFLNNFNAIIASSRDLLPPRKNAYHIPNGVNPEQFIQKNNVQKQALKKNYGLTDKIIFLCPRRWAPNKGVLYLAKALQLLPVEIKKKAVFLFAGNETQDFPAYTQKILAALKNTTAVDFRLIGNLNHQELIEFINLSDVGIIPSLVEGMSLSSIEFLSCGVPIVATNIGGLPEVIINNENGWIIPAKNAEALAAKISSIVSHWPKSNLIIKTEDFRKKYSWDVIAQTTLEIYKKHQ